MVQEPHREEEVGERVWQISGAHGWGSGVNAVAIVSGKRAVVVDNLYRPREARRLIRRIQQWGVEPVALVNTHWHTDDTIGNCLFGCPIWAHMSGPRALKRYWPQWVGSLRDKRAGGLRLKLPDHLFERRATLELDGEEISLIHVTGHTADSIGVFLPDRRLFVAGDAVTDLPFVRFGESLEAIRSLRRIQRLRPKTILQGHGRPCTGARLAGDIRHLQAVREKARAARRAGLSRQKFLETPLGRVLPGARVRSLAKGYAAAHRGNLEKIWNETTTSS
jgi:glyoxylase-like metal-dependent hydrolase (beta-lactamase superfamily II)